jgi:membrane-associated phospholipid phosphatase
MDQLLTLLANICLFWAHPITVFGLFLIGFIFHNRTIWGIAIILSSFSLILNPALKEYFHLPRPEGGGDEFGFPSGHFFGSMAFYGWVALMWPNRLVRFAIAIILAGIGFGLVYKGYHYPRDIAGSFGFASLLILFAIVILKIPTFKNKPPLLGALLLIISSAPLWYMYSVEEITKGQWHGVEALTLTSFVWLIAFPFIKDKKHG